MQTDRRHGLADRAARNGRRVLQNPHSWKTRTAAHAIADGVIVQPITGYGGLYVMTNCYLVDAESGWFLLDTGVPDSEDRILQTARSVHGGRPPEAVILTHAHFDHYGSAAALSDIWNVPIYAHPLDLPYLTGRDSLPAYDPTVGGFVSQLSRSFPLSGTDLGRRVEPLPSDGRIPGAGDWRWLPTPGHTPGHVSLFRERDRVLLAGDALITVDQDSVRDAILVRQSLHGPSTFATYDWQAAHASVAKLAELCPVTVATGHGEPMTGPHVTRQLQTLAERFQTVAVPSHGRYVDRAIDAGENGVVSVPAKPFDALPAIASIVGAAAAVAITGALAHARRRKRD